MKSVGELLKRHDGSLWHVRPTDTVFDALRTLANYDVGALLVMDGDTLVGVFSERDYTRKISLQGRNSKETLVSDIMTSDVFTVNRRSRVRDCMQLMSEKKIRHLPVLEGNTVLGMISVRDIVDDIISDQQMTIEQLQNYIHS